MTENVPFLHFSPTNTSCVVHRLKQGTDTNHRHKFPTSLEMNHFRVFIVADMTGRAIAYADRNIPNNPGAKEPDIPIRSGTKDLAQKIMQIDRLQELAVGRRALLVRSRQQC